MLFMKFHFSLISLILLNNLRFFYCLACLFFCFTEAFSSGYIQVEDVLVKSEGKDALSAKQQAMSRAERLAFSKMLDAEFPEASFLKNKVRLTDVASMIYDYSINKEKVSAKGYTAKFSYRFSRSKVLSFLRKYGINVADESAQNYKTIAVFPSTYQSHKSLFSQAKIVSFSSKKIVLEIPSKMLEELNRSQIVFVEIQ